MAVRKYIWSFEISFVRSFRKLRAFYYNRHILKNASLIIGFFKTVIFYQNNIKSRFLQLIIIYNKTILFSNTLSLDFSSFIFQNHYKLSTCPHPSNLLVAHIFLIFWRFIKNYNFCFTTLRFIRTYFRVNINRRITRIIVWWCVSFLDDVNCIVFKSLCNLPAVNRNRLWRSFCAALLVAA